MSTSALARVLLTMVALLALAWLAAGLRATELAEDGAAVVLSAQRGPIPPAEARRGHDLLQRAGELNADLDPLLRRGFLFLLTRDKASALDIADDAVEREPENANAWYLAYLVAQSYGDEGDSARTLRVLRALNPVLADTLGRR
jgi:hypothetical protein